MFDILYQILAILGVCVVVAYLTIVMIGMCFIAQYGSILDFIRKPLRKIKFFDELFKCSLCVGFHIGAFTGTLIALATEFILYPYLNVTGISYYIIPTFIFAVMNGCYSSAICWFADHVIDVMHIYIHGKK